MKRLISILLLVILVSCDGSQVGGQTGGDTNASNTGMKKCLEQNFEKLKFEALENHQEFSNEYYAVISFKIKHTCPKISFETLSKKLMN